MLGVALAPRCSLNQSCLTLMIFTTQFLPLLLIPRRIATSPSWAPALSSMLPKMTTVTLGMTVKMMLLLLSLLHLPHGEDAGVN